MNLPLPSRKGKALPLALVLLLAFLSAAQAALLPPPTPSQARALLILRETVTLLEESYAAFPDLRKAYAEGLYAMQRAIGKGRLEVIRKSPRRFALRAGGEEAEFRLEGGAREGLEAFERAYRFAMAHAAPEKEGRDLEVMYEALGAIASSLDPFSAFLPPDRFRALQAETSGRYGGIGITISSREGKLLVVSPIEDSPAFEAGIMAGDEIVAVNGEPIRGLPLAQTVRRMRGPPGTEVRLTIWRGGWEAPRDFTLVRALIHIRSVRTRIFEGGLGYLRVGAFHQETTRELDRGLERLAEAGVRGLVIDLRNNPGGLLLQAVRVAERFLPEGSMVVFTRGRHRGQTLHFRTRANGAWAGRPLVVLINRGSASASEIVAGAFQDLDRALLIGRTTFGKGSVQTILPVSHGAGVRLTTAKYYTPLGREIHHRGIHPDVEMEDGPRPPAAPPRKPDARGDPLAPSARVEPLSDARGDPPLEAALQILRETDGPGLEALRLAALRVGARRMEGIPKADVPAEAGPR